MSKLFCHLIGRHRPALVVVAYADGRPVTAAVCATCGARTDRA